MQVHAKESENAVLFTEQSGLSRVVNPIVPGIGMCDAHAHCFERGSDHYAAHDAPANNPTPPTTTGGFGATAP